MEANLDKYLLTGYHGGVAGRSGGAAWRSADGAPDRASLARHGRTRASCGPSPTSMCDR